MVAVIPETPTTTELANAANSPWCMAKEKFYQDPTTNHYSKAIHANTVEGLAYAFQSDDHCNESSYVSLINLPSVRALGWTTIDHLW